MLTWLLAGLIVVMKLFPTTPAARALHRAFVERPLEKLSAMDRRHLIFAVIALAMLSTGLEMVMLLGSTDLLMLMAWDVSLYVDAVIAVWTVAAVTRLKGAWRYALGRIAAPFRAARPRTSRRRIATAHPPANDADEDGAGWSYALAA